MKSLQNLFLSGFVLMLCFTARAQSPYSGWQKHGSLFLITTPEGANLPAEALVKDFPLLVRLHRDFFDFKEAKPHGEDIRFSLSEGTPLPYEIEEWNPAAGLASIWVRIPIIRGNARQEIMMHWGRSEAASESRGAAVFGPTNGYLSVWHLGTDVQDVVGTLSTVNRGTTGTPGIIGEGRHFAGDQGLFGGDKIPDYPTGDSAHTTEGWFRAEKPNTTIIGWGNEGGGRGCKVQMQLRSPSHIHIDSDFSDVNGETRLPMGEWIHVAHTYARGEGRLYINGKPDASNRVRLAIKTPARLWIGGWYDRYDFVGDMDEVRVSQVARSADWIRLDVENQKPMQTLVGPLVQSGSDFSLSAKQSTIPEGSTLTIRAKAGGAQKIYWLLRRNGTEKVVAVDRLEYTLEAGRTVGDQTAELTVKAVYPTGTRSSSLPFTIKEALPEPVFELTAPARWDGRRSLTLKPRITNLAQMQAKGAGTLRYRWSVSGIATLTQAATDSLRLDRAQNSGRMTVTLALDNGGVETTHSVVIDVREPATDPAIVRTPAPDEKPEANRFYPCDASGEGVLFYNGSLKSESDSSASAEMVFLKLYDEKGLRKTVRSRVVKDGNYTLSVRLAAGLVRYRVQFGTVQAGQEKMLHEVENLVCGDVFLIDGQSNAVATAWGDAPFDYTSDWIRSFGFSESDPNQSRQRLWGNAVARSPGGRLQIGYWGMELARHIVETEKVPVCFLNGAVGGTRIDLHQRKTADPEDPTTIYGRLLWRVHAAGLTHGVRGIFWHQGENDQGADGPTGGYGWETYRDYFVEMAAGWKRDYPNVRHYYMFQIWPKSCGMGIDGSDNRLREVQRELPTLFSNLSLMSTLGIEPPGGCHYPPAGYVEFARLIAPLVERYNYGRLTTASITPPDLKRVRRVGPDELLLEFDQPTAWNPTLVSEFLVDGVRGRVASGSAQGNAIRLRLSGNGSATKLTYLDSANWSQARLLRGVNGIAALTFCEVPIEAGAGRSKAVPGPSE